MKVFKKLILIMLIMINVLVLGGLVGVDAVDLVPIPKSSGGNVTYRSTSIEVKMPSAYIPQESDFRAVWISPLVGDLSAFGSVSQFKNQMYIVFDTLEYFNMNAMIFHMRLNNDALYKSSLNPLASVFRNVNFDEFDPINWTINECHKRGIEFHAWLNPYRLGSSTLGMTIEDYAKTFPSYNIASNPDYILKGTSGVILNPGEVSVRKFIVDTCMEIIENYDVDAIHFDDYFYIGGVDDAVTRAKYNLNNLTIADFRRQQVDLFVEALSSKMREYNTLNNRHVQLGISPTGIYRNGSYQATPVYDANGSLITPVGSNTVGFQHYGDYLYCDTKKWVDNEWIDYILPQSYWSFEDTAAAYADVMDWWVKVVRNKNVNLYSGMGIYQAIEANRGSWNTNVNEAGNQVQYASQYPEIKGHCVFSYSQVQSAYLTKSGVFYNNLSRVKELMWNNKAVLPEIKTYTAINLPKISNLAISKNDYGFRLDFDKMESAKSYVIYRSSNPITYAPTEVIDIVGNEFSTNKISYFDKVNPTQVYYYAIKPQSATNTLGEGTNVNSTEATSGAQMLTIEPFENVFFSDYNYFNGFLTVRWDEIHPLFGNEPSYEVYYSTNNVDFNKLNTTTYPIIESGGYFQTRIPLDSSPLVYVYLKAQNDYGNNQSSVETISVSKRIGNIYNFTYRGTAYTNELITFMWNKLKAEDATYVVQYSSDGVEWEDITSENNPIVFEGQNCYQPFILPSNPSTLSFRVVATNPLGFAISQLLSIDIPSYLGDLELLVNGLPYEGPITATEEEQITITWNDLSTSLQTVNYKTQMSANLVNWSLSTSFYSSNKAVIGTSQVLEMGFQHYRVFYRVEASTSEGNSISQIIEINVYVSDVQLTQFLKYMDVSKAIFFEQMNIYK
ncbi:MAG: glycoside hydrolase family 10 protein [Bacilli bacterium]